MPDNSLVHVVKDFDSICDSEIRVIQDLFGNTNPQYSAKVISEIKKIKNSKLHIPPQKAEELAQIWGTHKVDVNLQKCYGAHFAKSTNPFALNFARSIRRDNSLFIKKPSGTGVTPHNVKISSPRGKFPKINIARVVKPIGRYGSRGLSSAISIYAPVIVDVVFFLREDYKINDEFTRGLISETEKVERKYKNTGSSVGGAIGAIGGAAIGEEITKDGDYSTKEKFIITGISTVLGGLIGSSVGKETAKVVYVTVNRPVYDVCVDACKIGDVDAMFFNGLYHYEGRYVEKDLDTAHFWFINSAREGDVRAQFYSGLCSYSNSKEEAAFWWNLAANSFVNEKRFDECRNAARYNLACLLMNGEGVKQNQFEAISYLAKASKEGNKEAKKYLDQIVKTCNDNIKKSNQVAISAKTLGDYYYWLGDYENNNKDYYKKAIEYYEKAYQLECYDALFGLGNIYELGLGVEKDISTAMECYKGAANHNVPGATKKFVYLVDKESKWAENIDWLVEKSNEENDEACYKLAWLAYECSKDPTHHNLEPFKDKNRNDLLNLYVKLLERAETLENIEAGFMLAAAQYFEYDLVKKHISDSSFETYNMRLKRSAIIDNNAKAQLMLAKSYSKDRITRNGIKAPKEDKVMSAFWYAVAAINGDAEAQYYFGKCCELGYGVPKNKDKANKWYNKTDFVEPNKFIKFFKDLF